jgi:hypothetical protein
MGRRRGRSVSEPAARLRWAGPIRRIPTLAIAAAVLLTPPVFGLGEQDPAPSPTET